MTITNDGRIGGTVNAYYGQQKKRVTWKAIAPWVSYYNLNRFFSLGCI